MNDARVQDFPAVLLPGRKVLVAGGIGSDGSTSIKFAEIYDEATNTWTRTASMNVARQEFNTVVLNDGRVLATGGVTEEFVPTATAEIYNPVTKTWTLTGSMNTARADHAAVRLLDGRVLVPGGHKAQSTPVSSADLYDPRTGTWADAGSMSVTRAGHSSIVLRGNRGVLEMGGLSPDPAATASVDIALQTH
jgi:N-acetylneuraminic acid mutarotase